VAYNPPADDRNDWNLLAHRRPRARSSGKNDFEKIGYGGPCPPTGTHRYFFKIYALDDELPLKAGATKADVENAMSGHILAQAQLLGTYRK
jgi:Raf kinase inhibitor-like YbhB/YbcL family protein